MAKPSGGFWPYNPKFPASFYAPSVSNIGYPNISARGPDGQSYPRMSNDTNGTFHFMTSQVPLNVLNASDLRVILILEGGNSGGAGGD